VNLALQRTIFSLLFLAGLLLIEYGQGIVKPFGWMLLGAAAMFYLMSALEWKRRQKTDKQKAFQDGDSNRK
jgi:predicted PurR-regulated permease PerM